MKTLYYQIKKTIFKPNSLLLIPYWIISIILVIIPLCIVVFYAIRPGYDSIDSSSFNLKDTTDIVTNTTWSAIGNSLWLSLLTTIICLVISYPLSYLLAFRSNKTYQFLTLTLITAPIWINFLIKLIGIKTLLDLIHNQSNSTFSHFYTLIGLVYIYFPFSLIPIYSVLTQMPRNIINASHDLGSNNVKTFFNIILPYSFPGMLSAIVLVFLPSFTTVAVGEFLNNSNSGALIGSLTNTQAIWGIDSPVALSRASFLSLFISVIILLVYLIIKITPNVYQFLTSTNKKKRILDQINRLKVVHPIKPNLSLNSNSLRSSVQKQHLNRQWSR